MFILFQGGIFSFHVVVGDKAIPYLCLLCMLYEYTPMTAKNILEISMDLVGTLWSWQLFLISFEYYGLIYIYMIVYDTIMWYSHWHKHTYCELIYDILIHTNAPITPCAILDFRSSLRRCVNQSVSSVSVSRYCFESVGGKEGKVIRHIVMTRWDLFRIPTPNPTNTSTTMHPELSEKHQFQFT